MIYMIYMISTNGKKSEVKLIGDLVFVKENFSVSDRNFYKLRPWKYEVWSCKGKLEDFEKGESSNGYFVLFDF